MEARQPSFMLLPSFGFLPDQDIQLGTVLTTAKGSKLPDAKRPLNKASRVTVNADDVHEQPWAPWSWDSTKSGSNKLSLTADVSLVAGIGAGISGKWGQDRGLVIESDRVDVRWFRPDAAYLAKTLQDDLVKTVGWKLTRPPLFLVTGLMIATGTTVTVTDAKNHAFSAHATADLTSLSVPLAVGPAVEHTRDSSSKLSGVPTEPFILAYELVRLRKKRDGGVEEQDENTWALFNDEVPIEPGSGAQVAEALKQEWEVGWVQPSEFVVEL
ncbi:hypothetical protein LTR62_006046 [Meristemomyces frigidus]|uniref:Uncharacterized protein n=1 Tax=Meristemomyces frigidus TaxID=1508187 RepID=A0AAN7YQ66_9PEZI|nr:hypothetical protein LTR62_006046 [Meristemomyces frigidus]